MTNLFPQPNFRLIGHRGTGGLRPENTYCSFRNAADLGLNWVEYDVQLTKDDYWLVMHDETIDRTTNGRGKVADHTLKDLMQLQAGLWYNPPYLNQPVPSLKRALQFCRTFGLQSNIEIKGSITDPQKYADLMYKFLIDRIRDTEVPPLLSSFDTNCIIALRKLLPNLPIAYLIDNFSSETIEICQAYQFTCINCDVDTITAQDLRSATAANIPVLLYTVNDLASARTWFAAGVAAIFTDRADLLLHA